VPANVPPATVVNGVSPDATPKAAVEEVCAPSDAASAAFVVPFTRPGGKPVIEVPGESPTSPVMTLGPVFVIVVPATIAYGVAAPRLTVVAANALSLENASNVTALSSPTPSTLRWRL